MTPRDLHSPPRLRVGLGRDLHRLAPGRPLILGGVEIPFDQGLLGHSDADVLTHAVCDALLGAAALGDIGTHFPDTDSRFAGVSSLELLDTVVDLIATNGYRVANVDCVVEAERPRVAPHVPEIVRRLAERLRVSVESVHVKGKTGEGVGPVGRGEAIAASSVCLIEKLPP